MEPFDFDRPVDRAGTDSLKWERYRDKDILPMWVADMDFRSPEAVIRAIRDRADHGVFGYSVPPADLGSTVANRLKTDYGWSIEPEWIRWLPGMVTGLNVACRSVGDPGDEVIIMTPVYPPFFTAPTHMGRKCVPVPLGEKNGRWFMDLDRFAAAITSRTRMVMLCNPHNPVGRVFNREELAGLMDLCHRHDLVVCSDEIHCGLILDSGMPHLPVAALGEDAARRTITLMAPSKTYNIPGLGCAFAVIADPDLRRRFKKAMAGIVPDVTVMGYAATLAAYQEGDAWLAALLAYLRGNRDYLLEEINTLPGLSMATPEATYLGWIDTRESGIATPGKFFESAGVGLSDGKPFGGEGFVRLNFGCSRRALKTAVDRMRKALADR